MTINARNVELYWLGSLVGGGPEAVAGRRERRVRSLEWYRVSKLTHFERVDIYLLEYVRLEAVAAAGKVMVGCLTATTGWAVAYGDPILTGCVLVVDRPTVNTGLVAIVVADRVKLGFIIRDPAGDQTLSRSGTPLNYSLTFRDVDPVRVEVLLEDSGV
ncbi:hypothetical protein FIBSPDRAFT_904867 [Athelia psychrophila]|uniref:Uncharacterized protein n=1 Tax=Athelia psychrophila TaxID=1759441 RepID=A0A167U6X3_9AGAM|nr:hypothetical protein FIBSPDRAFT_904867 [Fibularhizoctonia sp. CBS 109695]